MTRCPFSLNRWREMSTVKSRLWAALEALEDEEGCAAEQVDFDEGAYDEFVVNYSRIESAMYAALAADSECYKTEGTENG